MQVFNQRQIERQFLDFIAMRIREAEAALGRKLNITYDFGDYEHFKTARGYGVTFNEVTHCHIRMSRKSFEHDISRFDGVLRHELGHAADMLMPGRSLFDWCANKEIFLATTPEVRADQVAHAIWGTPILYDKDTVQNVKYGKPGRPAHLPQ